MISTFLLIIVMTAGGTALTYLYERNDPLTTRLAAGHVIGAAIFGTLAFVLACIFGFSLPVAAVALGGALAPVVLFRRADLRQRLVLDWRAARSRTHGASLGKLLRAGYYIGFLLLFVFFFDRAMIVRPDGIFTGGSQNLGDLPFHLGAIFSFTEGNNFPPENPSFAGAKFTYPFLVNLVTAAFVEFGATVRDALFVQNVALGMSLVVLLEKFVVALTGSRRAGRIAPVLFFFSGGLGFVWFFRDYWQGAQGLWEILWKLPQDYTINDGFRWGNSLVALFLTQRGLLFGMPLALIALVAIARIFTENKPPADTAANDGNAVPAGFPFSFLLVGLLAGMLVLIHVHSLVALFVVCALLFFFRLDRWREWLAFGAGVSLVAVPELVWSLTGSASNLTKFVEPFFGWDSRGQNFIVFWAKNIGFFAPALLAGLYLLYRRSRAEAAAEASEEAAAPKTKKEAAARAKKAAARRLPVAFEDLAVFYLPFAFLFLVSNTFKLAPWEWDNVKVLVYWFVGSLPFAAYALAWLWEKGAAWRAAAAVGLVALTLAGALDIWRTATRQINYQVFSADAVKLAELIRQKTPPKALFLNAPTYNSAVVLAGRRSLMRYSGHLSSYGIDYEPRESEVKRIYEGGALAERFLQKNNIEYVIISPEETANLAVREEFFYKYPIIAESGAYKVFKVK